MGIPIPTPGCCRLTAGLCSNTPCHPCACRHSAQIDVGPLGCQRASGGTGYRIDVAADATVNSYWVEAPYPSVGV